MYEVELILVLIVFNYRYYLSMPIKKQHVHLCRDQSKKLFVYGNLLNEKKMTQEIFLNCKMKCIVFKSFQF